MTSDDLVRKRLVFALWGYEPLEAGHQNRRFEREIRRFETTWGVNCVVGAPIERDGAAGWSVDTKAPNWRVATEFRLLAWDDIVAADFARSDVRRLIDGVTALGDFIVSGTMIRYFRTNWRYALFFLYPAVMLISFVAAGLYAARLAGQVGLLAALAPVIAVAVAVGLWLFLRARFYLAYILDDWHFARDLVRGRRPALDQRLDRFAAMIADEAAASEADEILFVGYSLGAALMLLVLERALARQPALASRARHVALMTIGSSILKVGLHPAASALRQAAATVAQTKALPWVEYQARSDIINFFRCNPIIEMGIAAPPPEVRTVSVRKTLDPATYRRFRWDFFRMHRQFVMGNEQRYHYDYFMMLCGPLALATRLAAPEAAVAAFGADGTLGTGTPEGAA